MIKYGEDILFCKHFYLEDSLYLEDLSTYQVIKDLDYKRKESYNQIIKISLNYEYDDDKARMIWSKEDNEIN